MISFVFLSAFVLVSGAGRAQDAGAPASGDVGGRVLTSDGYMIRYGDSLYRYPVPVRIVPPAERNPTETNEIENGDEEKRRPLFYFTEGSPREALPTSGPYIEIRKKRNVDDADVPESSKVGKLRRKRTYCGRCGKGGGYGGYGGSVGYYIPVTFAVYPVYYGGGGGGGRGKGCYTCGGGGHGGGYGGGYGGGGSYSYSQSSASSSAGSYGWGKK